MSFPLNLFSSECIDQEFFSVIDRLKKESILPSHSFVKDLPFFRLSQISMSSHIQELFFNACDVDLYNTFLHRIAPNEDSETFESLSQKLSKCGVMNFAQLVLYKVLPCPNSECTQCPREIATHNQYKDSEYECPFYHHEKDRRRLVITMDTEEEFVYKANYFEEGRRNGDKEKYSQNYFESMFHPLYYKMFRCKRDYCNASSFCPFFHNNDEKRIWDELFSSFVRKDRVSYVKDKQKYYESNTKGPEVKQVKAEEFYYEKNRQQKNGRNRKHFNQQPNQMYYQVSEKSERSRPSMKGPNSTWNVSSEDAYCGFYGSKSNKDLMGQEVC